MAFAILKNSDLSQRKTGFPKVSVIIPCYECSQYIALTIESVLNQEYHDFEVIVIDGGSQDRTLEIVKSYFDDRIRIYSVATLRAIEMLNKGISISRGMYLHFLLPGDFFLHNRALEKTMEMAVEYSSPHLLYTAGMIRERDSDVSLNFYPLDQKHLARGQEPTCLQSCFFHQKIFQVLGKFSTELHECASFDFFCRILQQGNLRIISSKRVHVDSIVRPESRRAVLRRFFETFTLIRTYFGLISAIRWLWIQKELRRFFDLWKRAFQLAFFRMRPN